MHKSLKYLTTQENGYLLFNAIDRKISISIQPFQFTIQPNDNYSLNENKYFYVNMIFMLRE